MKPVTAHYQLEAQCTEAEGTRKGDCIRATALFTLILDTDTRTLLTGSGPVKACGELLQLKLSDGSDGLQRVAVQHRRFGPIDCSLCAGRLGIDFKVADAVAVHMHAYLMPEGAAIAYGHCTCEVTKWTWRFKLKRLEADVGGKLIRQEFYEGV